MTARASAALPQVDCRDDFCTPVCVRVCVCVCRRGSADGALSAEMREKLAGSGARRPSPARGRDRDRDRGRASGARSSSQRGRGDSPDGARRDRGESSRDRVLREKKQQLADLKRERNEALEGAKLLISNLQPGGRSPVEQKALQLKYDVLDDTWTQHRCSLRMESKPLAEGGMRWCVRMMLDTRPDGSRNGKKDEAVAKFFKAGTFRSIRTETRSFFAEAMTQMHARHLAELFNKEMGKKGLQAAIRPIRMLPASVASLVEAKAQLINIEPILEGKFVKHNDNDGNVSSKEEVPQAFSHFSFHVSGGSVLVCDIQGVASNYTDPQIHSIDGKGFGIGNIGKEGMTAFIKTHKCNRICSKLGLPRPQMPKDLSSAQGIWSAQRFADAVRTGMEMLGLHDDRATKSPQEEAAEKAKVLQLLMQKKLLAAQLAQRQAMLVESSPRVSNGNDASPRPASPLRTPTGSEAKSNIEAQRAFLLEQLEKRKQELAQRSLGDQSKEQQSDVGDVELGVAQQRRVLAEQIERTQKLLHEHRQRSRSGSRTAPERTDANTSSSHVHTAPSANMGGSLSMLEAANVQRRLDEAASSAVVTSSPAPPALAALSAQEQDSIRAKLQVRLVVMSPGSLSIFVNPDVS